MNYLISLNYALKMVKTINFMLFVFYHNKKKMRVGEKMRQSVAKPGG